MHSTQMSLLLLLSPRPPISDISPANSLLLPTGHERPKASMASALARRRAQHQVSRLRGGL